MRSMFVELVMFTAIVWLCCMSIERLKVNLLGECVLGLLAGFVWEMTTEPLWIYNLGAPMLFIWKDVPLGIILSWAFVLMFASLVSRYMVKRFSLVKLKKILADAVAILLVAVSFEALGHYVFGFWEYAIPDPFIKVIVGWVVIGTFLLAFIDKYDEEIERFLEKRLRRSLPW